MNSTELKCLNSPGIWIGEKFSVSEFLSYSTPLLELQLGIMLMISHGFSFILARFGISMFISQLLTGIILGPTILGRFDFMKEFIFPIKSHEVLTELASLGFRLHIFLTGVDINLESAKRLTGKFAITTGLSSVLVPLGVGLAILKPLNGSHFKKKELFFESLTFIVVQCFSTFSVVVRVLKDLKIPNSEIGHQLLSSAMISGAISVQVLVACSIIFSGKWLIDFSAYIGFLIVLAFLIRPGINWIIRRIPVGSPVDSSITCSFMMMALISDAYCVMFNQIPGVGAYTFGVIVPAGPPLGSSCKEKFETFTNSFLLPISIVTSTMKTDLTIIFTHFGEMRIYVLIVIAIGVVKMLCCLVPMRVFCEISFVDSVLFATIMTNRGAIEMALCLFSSEKKLLSEPTYALLILVILTMSLIVSMIVKRMYDPTKNYAFYKDRNIISLKPDSKLRILVCVHDQDNMYSVTRFLDAFLPTREKFLVLHVLHLVPLDGLNTPIIISNKKQNLVSEDSPSNNLIIHFNQYEERNSEGTYVSTYTSISPLCSMNEDISILAFNHTASIIILPFHRKWSIHGKIEAEDKNIRAINLKILEKAPCSVSIFFDRGKLGRRTKVSSSVGSPLSICVIFLGGKDDWEALSLAKRTVRDTSSRLTVIHFMLKNKVHDVEAARDDKSKDDADRELDGKALEIMLKMYEQNKTCLRNIEYVKKFVNDGPETAMAIRSIANKHDLFMVGRRYRIKSPITSGLSEWVEIPELGIIGDILASKDVDTRAAVLVVQQQIRKLS
ncbi:Cation/hydrogen exchanger family protein [Euphorbia peplus]|nr:Cation/hydrogen exchanger family protein [Euphorbia peplus]